MNPVAIPTELIAALHLPYAWAMPIEEFAANIYLMAATLAILLPLYTAYEAFVAIRLWKQTREREASITTAEGGTAHV